MILVEVLDSCLHLIKLSSCE